MSTTETMANLAAELAEDTGAVQRVHEHSADTVLVRTLVDWRTAKKLSQRQLAAKMGVSPSKVCRMEAARDADLNWGDIVKYCNAMGVSLSMLFDDPKLPAAERIKHHVMATYTLLQELQALAQELGDGDDITSKIKQFYGDVLFNFTIRFADCYSKLPKSGPTRVSTGLAETAGATDGIDREELAAR